MIDDQRHAQSISSTPHAAIDPKSRHAVQLNSKSCDDTSFKTLHLFLKTKVLRSPVEPTADCVEKLRISVAVIFRKEPVKLQSQMRSAMRRIELAHEQQKANWAEPLAAKSWSVCAGINFFDFAKNGVFQQYRPGVTVALLREPGLSPHCRKAIDSPYVRCGELDVNQFLSSGMETRYLRESRTKGSNMQVPPFNTYYPSLGDMNRDQKRFYRYFSRAVAAGEYVDVKDQISYVFCYVYQEIDQKNPRKSLRVLSRLATLYKDHPKLPDYLNGWAADCAILTNDLGLALQLLPEPQLGAAWGLTANTQLSLKYALKMPPAPREMIAVVGPKVTKYGRENLEDVEQYLGVILKEMQSRSSDLISGWIRDYQVHSTAFSPFNGVPIDHLIHSKFTAYHFSNRDEFRNYVADLIRQAENALRVDKGLPCIGEGWISETHLYYQLKDAFSEHQVQQHARPSWLGRQHLDVFFQSCPLQSNFKANSMIDRSSSSADRRLSKKTNAGIRGNGRHVNATGLRLLKYAKATTLIN